MTSGRPEFVDEKFEVIPVKVSLPLKDGGAPEKGINQPTGSPAQTADYNEQDCMMICSALFSIPSIVYDKIPLRTEKDLTAFNHQLYIYCVRKNINPFDYFFDEFGIVVAGITVCGGIVRDYKKEYGKDRDTRTTAEKKLSNDYDHEKEVAEKNRIAQELDGIIK